jgi:hypothetical protein
MLNPHRTTSTWLTQLMSHNRKFGRIPNLTIENWTH